VGGIPIWRDNQSRKAVQWLIWKEREIGRRIIHVGRGREYRLTQGMLVDGYYECENKDTTQRHVFQFHDCFFHGCPTCYRINRDKILANFGDTIDARYERTLATSWGLRRLGYIITEK